MLWFPVSVFTWSELPDRPVTLCQINKSHRPTCQWWCCCHCKIFGSFFQICPFFSTSIQWTAARNGEQQVWQTWMTTPYVTAVQQGLHVLHQVILLALCVMPLKAKEVPWDFLKETFSIKLAIYIYIHVIFLFILSSLSLVLYVS